MRLPFRDPIDLGPSPYEQFLQSEAIPVLKGYFIEDLKESREKSQWSKSKEVGENVYGNSRL